MHRAWHWYPWQYPTVIDAAGINTRMRIFELLLLEYDVSRVTSLASKLRSRTKDPSAPPAQTPVDLAQAIESMGVRNGETLFWILNRYLTPTENGYGINRWEDIAGRLLPALEKFAVLKRKPNLNPPLPTKDLNQIKSLGQLEDITEKYQEKELASKTAKAGAEEQAFYDSKQATLLYNDATFKVVVPHTKEASCYFGVNTQWCTAAKNDNQFNYYNEKGPLYSVLIKPLNQRFQFQWGEEPEFKDEQDEEINPNELADKYPVLWKIFTPIAEKNKSVVLNQNPTPEVQMAAVQQDGLAIKYIKNPSHEVQMAAVQQNGRAIKWIKNPNPELQFKLEMAAVQQDGWSIKWIKNPNPELQMAAVQQNGAAIYWIKNPNPELQFKLEMAAVQQNGEAIHWIKNPNPELQFKLEMAAVQQNGQVIHWIKNPNPELQFKLEMAAVQQIGWAIQWIKNPNPELQMAAVQQIGRAIQWIKNPNPKVIALARSQGYDEKGNKIA